MIYDGYDLWERFCIMTVDGNAPDIYALKVLKRQTTPRLYQWLEWKVNEEKRKWNLTNQKFSHVAPQTE